MSEYRQLHRSFWESPSVESMDPVEKLLYNYLITAPLSNMEGLYKTTVRRIALETGIDRDMVVQLCGRLEEKRLAGFNDGWVCVTQATVHMPDSPKMLKHAENLYTEVPKPVLEWAANMGYHFPPRLVDTVCIPYPTRLDNTRLDKTEESAPPKASGQETRKANLIDKYGKRVYEDYEERVRDYMASKGKRYKDIPATVANWLKRDNVSPRPGWGVATAKAPTTCPHCGSKVRDIGGTAMCVNDDCGTEWKLREGEWREA